MMRVCVCIGAAILILGAAWGQTADSTPKFDIADVHVSAAVQYPYSRALPLHGGRYEIKTASMVDLIRTAYGFDADKIFGGPSWLEMNRYDVIAKAPHDTPPETLKLMLQALLADRFKLAVHKDTKPLPTYALMAGKKPQLKQADGSEDTGCKIQTASGPPVEGGIRLSMMNANGTVSTIAIGPGMLIQYSCRNMTMEAFAAGLRGMMGANVGNNPVFDKTELKGAWNFDVRWSLQLNGGPAIAGDTGERTSIFEAMEKQLGLKLEQEQIPTPVIVVDSVNEKPSANPPGLAEALPPVATPAEFEVADIKPTDPDFKGGRLQTPPGGRFISQGLPFQFLLNRAFNAQNADQIVGMPKSMQSMRFDINAKAQVEAGTSIDQETMEILLQSLLTERFGLKYHKENRPMSAYTLVAGKPKMKKADPASRTHCISGAPPAGSPLGTQALTCQNITMTQFANQLRGMAAELSWPVEDGTGIEGGWDFTLTFTRGRIALNNGGGDAAAAGGAPSAADPSGGLTIFEAVDKELGLKLEMRKRPMTVFVIDHLDEKPTDN